MWLLLLASLAAAPAAEPSADDIFDRLTASVWYYGSHDKLVDFIRYAFRDDGTYLIEHITDHSSWKKAGKWNLQRDVAGEWFVCLDNGIRHRCELQAGARIRLAVWRLLPEGPQPRNPRLTAKTLPEFDLPPEVKKTIDRLTAHGWKRANDFNLEYTPTSIRFGRDFRYEAVYRDGDCASRGAWFASTEGSGASSPTAPCDKRERVGAVGGGFSMEFDKEGEGLLLGDELYVPEDRPLPPGRGVVRSFVIGRVNGTPIRLEYDRPIRAGAASRFDFTIRNDTKETLTVQRFSLTEAYHRYRDDAGGLGTPAPSEIAAKDLNDANLEPGKSIAFSVDVTFRKPLHAFVYFNFLMSGRVSPLDTCEPYQVAVQPEQ